MLEKKIQELYRITAELEEKYPGRRFRYQFYLWWIRGNRCSRNGCRGTGESEESETERGARN